MIQANRIQLETIVAEIEEYAALVEEIFHEEYEDREDLEELERAILPECLVTPHDNLEEAVEDLQNAADSLKAYFHGWELMLDKNAREQFVQEMLSIAERQKQQHAE